MNTDKRHNVDAIPDQFEEYLTSAQNEMLNTLESFGWTVKYLRRLDFKEVTVIMSGPNENVYAVLDKTGNLDKDITIPMRN